MREPSPNQAVEAARSARLTFERGDVPLALTQLAEAFVCLRGAPGVRPFEAARLSEWSRTTDITRQQRDCAEFVLHVAQARADSGARFDPLETMERLDPTSRAVLVEWAQHAWWS
jgi:hypothetical protein